MALASHDDVEQAVYGLEQEVNARLTVIERALEAVIEDIEAIATVLNGGPETEDDGGPDDLRMGYGSNDPEGDWEQHEMAATGSIDHIAAVEAANESEPQLDSDPNSLLDVPEEGITLQPGSDDARMDVNEEPNAGWPPQ